MKKINKNDIILLISLFTITCLIFIPFLTGHYATDTYNISNVGYENYAIKWSLKDGRIIMALIGLIANKINISIELYVFITLVIALLISNITVMTLNKIIKKYKQPTDIFQKIILISICYITIFNFMYLEDMYFVENIVMSLSILLYLKSADIIVERKKHYIIKSLILVSIGIISYQGTIGMYFSFIILFTILKNKNNIKPIVEDLIKSVIIALIPISLNFIMVKMIINTNNINGIRFRENIEILNNIITILVTLPDILQETCNLFPRNILLLYILILTLIILAYRLKNLKEKNNSIIYKYILITIIIILSSCTTYILTLTSFYTGRLRNALGALIGLIFIFTYTETSILQKKGILNLITMITLISFLLINIFNYESIMLQHKKVNKLEKQEVEDIEQYIKNYEESTGIKVTKIAKVPIYNNKDKVYFPNTKNKTSFTHDALKTSWAADGAINFYTKRNLENIIITNEQKNKYLETNNEELDYKCIEDILFINVYYF